MTTTVTAAPQFLILTSMHGREIGLTSGRSLVVKAMHRSWSFSAASGAANVCNITLQACDNEGSPIKALLNFDFWLSDSATGAGLAATGGSSELTCSTGALIGIYTTLKAWRLQTDVNGVCVAVVTATGKPLDFACASVTGHAGAIVSTQLAAANYG